MAFRVFHHCWKERWKTGRKMLKYLNVELLSWLKSSRVTLRRVASLMS
ncbi:hypothetical protein FOMG_19428 [Fusarium oxysporum f. sp. melonis 26406]|uniref:Uncharacterized protein n=1 Tax=Fusarium oxysporum f. sp. melonis 26406 TaxID=1089452 RepID=W9YW67_FUSOX|nr:hypothetical protein FOMG_19428 [Fusarium oxysporum f. sp. melonis 26406]